MVSGNHYLGAENNTYTLKALPNKEIISYILKYFNFIKKKILKYKFKYNIIISNNI